MRFSSIFWAWLAPTWAPITPCRVNGIKEVKKVLYWFLFHPTKNFSSSLIDCKTERSELSMRVYWLFCCWSDQKSQWTIKVVHEHAEWVYIESNAHSGIAKRAKLMKSNKIFIKLDWLQSTYTQHHTQMSFRLSFFQSTLKHIHTGNIKFSRVASAWRF